MLACRPVALADSGDLRHPGAGDHARGADGSGADTYLDAIHAGFDQRLCPFIGGDIARHKGDFRKMPLDRANGFENTGGVAMRRVDREHVDPGADQLGGTLEKVAGRADRRPHPQAALIVFRGVGVLELLLDVFDRDQALKLVLRR